MEILAIFFDIVLFFGRIISVPFPSTKTISSKLSITLPYFSDLEPLELFAIIPPILQKAPTEGFGPKNFLLCFRIKSNSPLLTPAPTITCFLDNFILLKFFISKIMPVVKELPTSPVEPPRAQTGIFLFLANLMVFFTSSIDLGNTINLCLFE